MITHVILRKICSLTPQVVVTVSSFYNHPVRVTRQKNEASKATEKNL